MVPKHRDCERMVKLIADDYIKSGPVSRFLHISCLEIIFFTKSIIDNWNWRLNTLEVFIVATGNNAFFHLLGHLFKSLEDIIYAGKVIREIIIDIRHDRVIRMVSKEMTAIFTSFRYEEMRIFLAYPCSVPN